MGKGLGWGLNATRWEKHPIVSKFERRGQKLLDSHCPFVAGFFWKYNHLV
jgi:hypothetical protein